MTVHFSQADLIDSTTKVNGFQIGRNQLDPDLASDLNHSIARGWLEECRSTHEGCMPSKPPTLPTRVVDVGTSDLDTARIIHSNGLAAEYIALSHCWGGYIATTLTSKTSSQYQNALPQAELPANFRDSITIARQLGIRYLWIDSLCILQDSAQDWEKESQMMARVYGDATLTLSAIAASGSSIGLLTNHPIPTLQPSPVTLRIHASDDPAYHIIAYREDPEEESLRSLTNSAPLSLRGWTLQEAVLSPRTLFYGASQIYWSCPETYHAADGLCLHLKAPQSQYPAISQLLHTHTSPTATSPTTNDTPTLLEEYYALVAEYSNRTLSFPSDKFPALSGLARRLQPALQTEYLAGLWLSDIHRGLLWFPEVGFAPHVVPSRAPSWSWAATDERVLFEFVDPRDAGWTERPSGGMVEVKGREVVLAGADGFGGVVSGRLVVETRLMELVRSEQRAYFRESDGRMWYDEGFGGGVGEWAFQNLVVMDGFVLSVGTDVDAERDGIFEMDNDAEMERGYFLMLIHADEEGVEVEWRHASTKCLVVRRVEGEEDRVFERVGAALVYNTKASWLHSWKTCVAALV